MAMSKLDFEQIIKKVYNAVNNRLRVDAEVTATIGTVDVEINAADGDNIAISDGTDTLVVNPDGSINTNIVSPIDVNISASSGDNIKISDGTDDLAVNVDGSINTVDTTTHTKLDSLLTELSQKTEPSDVQNIRPISSGTDSINVPGVATSANQTTANTLLTSIDNKLTSPISVTGPLTNVELRASPVPISASSLPLPTGAATSANQASELTKLDTIHSDLASIDGKIPSQGQKVSAQSLPVVIASDQTVISTTDSATHTLLSSIDSGIPNSLGPNTKANSMPVTLATDQPAIPVTATLTDEPIKISGTENGQANGTEFTFVNNLKQKILSAKDRNQAITYADFGTKNQRITRVDYTATSIGTGSGYTARKNIVYVLDSGKYRRTNITWSLI